MSTNDNKKCNCGNCSTDQLDEATSELAGNISHALREAKVPHIFLVMNAKGNDARLLSALSSDFGPQVLLGIFNGLMEGLDRFCDKKYGVEFHVLIDEFTDLMDEYKDIEHPEVVNFLERIERVASDRKKESVVAQHDKQDAIKAFIDGLMGLKPEDN